MSEPGGEGMRSAGGQKPSEGACRAQTEGDRLGFQADRVDHSSSTQEVCLFTGLVSEK